MPVLLRDVFSLDEVARAAHVSRRAVEAAVASGRLRTVDGLLPPDVAVAVGRELRATALSEPATVPAMFSAMPDTTAFARRESRIPVVLSSSAHVIVLGLILWATAGAGETAGTAQAVEPARLVFLMTPGPGGGGGGGGNRARTPAPRLQRAGAPRPRLAVPKVTPDPVLTTAKPAEPSRPTPAVATPQPVPAAPEPAPAQLLVAPVQEAAADPRDRAGVIDGDASARDSVGQGAGGGAGAGQGTGNGEGLGAGIGEGSGGGTGGGPYRAGSGIEPPRLLREVKAEYTEDARRRNIRGDVVLEIVVRSDGTVGEVRVLQGLGGGLEARAIAAVRQWRFSPATRRGQPVDVIVEVAVEFTLR